MKGKSTFQNLVAALIVSFVALSLGASFGILSGRTDGAFIGMLSAGIIAFVTAMLGGTRVQCSGPTAPMTAVVAVLVAYAHDHIVTGDVGISANHFVNIVLILTGALLIFMGILRLGRFIKFVPNVVISGFMIGISLLIWLDQIKKLFGLGGKQAFEGSVPINILIAILTLAVILFVPRIAQRYFPKYSNYFSPTLIGIVLLTFVSNFLKLDIEHVNLLSSMSSWSEFSQMIKSQIPVQWSSQIVLIALPFAIQLAFLAYLDTLLTSLVVDKLSEEKTRQNKELMAQGMANGLVSLVGGIPGAQATIRSVLIIKEKATLRVTGMLVGVFVFVEIVLFKDYISLVPQAVFAGVLFKVGWDVFDFLPFKLYANELKKYGFSIFNDFFSSHKNEKIFITNREMLLIMGTVLVTIFVNLNLAVIIFTTLFYTANRFFWTKNPIRDLQPELETEGIANKEIVGGG